MQYPVPGLFCSLSTISMYCNLRAAVLLAYLRVLFLSMSISFIRHKPDKQPPPFPGQSIIPQAHMYKATLSRSGFPIIFLTGVPSEGDTHILAFQAAEEESDSITLYVAKEDTHILAFQAAEEESDSITFYVPMGEPRQVHHTQSLEDLAAGVTAAIITMPWQMLLPSRVRMLWSKLLAAYWMNSTETPCMSVLHDTISFILFAPSCRSSRIQV